MDVSVIIPVSENDRDRLNKTVDSFISSANGEVEVIAVLNGFNMDVDPRAIVIGHSQNMGERWAMNIGAKRASGKYIMRIDAHCTIDPGWDTKIIEVFEEHPHALVVPVLGALDDQWNLKPSHRYKFCKLLPTMEEKWWDKKEWGVIEPNMACTGCGMTMNKKWYLKHGGVDERLPKMGAIGPECSLMAHIYGDGVFTRTDVVLGHMWNVGGYDTSGVVKARQMLTAKYGDHYEDILSRYDIDDTTVRLKTTDNNKRVVTIRREDTHDTKDEDGKIIKRVIEHFCYVYEDDGTGPSEKELSKIYSPKASKVGEDTFLPDQEGVLVKV